MKHKTMKISLILTLLLAATALDVSAKPRHAKPKVQTARVEITGQGYEPASIKLRRGIPARVTFLRKTDATCAKEVIFTDFNIKRDLPLNKAVVITFTPTKTGEFTFTCGMNMMRGKLLVQ